MSQEQDYFQLSSGLPLDGAVATIVSSDFGFDAGYNNGETALAKLGFVVDGGDGEVKVQLYSVGKDFEPLDQGALVAHNSGKPIGFSGTSNYGAWIKAAVNAEGDFRAYAAKVGLQPNAAALWLNTRWELTSEKYIPFGGKDEKSRIVPKRFLGVEGDAPAAPAAKAAAAPAEGGEHWDALVAIAQEQETYDDYLAAALEYAAGDTAVQKMAVAKANNPWKATKG